MKKLIISVKTPSEALDNFRDAYKAIKKGKPKSPHYEISFDNKKDFQRFIKNIDILMSIQNLKPQSVYELSKMLGRDQSNLNKIILFFEDLGVIKIREKKIKNRSVKTPVVDYEKIEFDLSA